MKKRYIMITIGLILLLCSIFCILQLQRERQSERDEVAAIQELCNVDSTEETKGVFQKLNLLRGRYILSGQFCDDKYNRNELSAIAKITGEYPAITGFDFIRYSPSLVEMGESSRAVEWAIEEHENGSVITFCWHWNPSAQYLIHDKYNGARTENSFIKLDEIMNGKDDAGYQSLLKDMDAIAYQLQRLQKAGVPVIWRPLHEASGGWFWWGNCSPESYIKLYRLMYQRYTEEWKLNNLIWLWNGQDAAWYPGDDVVDLIGEDQYSAADDPQKDSFIRRYNQAARLYYRKGKMIVLSETSPQFDPDAAQKDGAVWSFFCLWGGSSICREMDSDELSEPCISEEMLERIYESLYVINREELRKVQ